MPRDSNGNTSPLPGTLVNSGDTILPSQHNPMVNDVYAMLTQSLSRDGQGGMRANLNMNGFQIQNVGAATGPDGVATVAMVDAVRVPIGVMYDWPGDSAPSNHMLCYGQAISRTTYAELFAILGTKFGSGNGSTTFNLPDFRGRVAVGKDDMGGSDSARMTFWGAAAKLIGGVFGTASVVLTVAQMPKHNHPGSTNATGDHTHRVPDGGNGGGPGAQNGPLTGGTFPTQSAGNHSHTVTTQDRGNDAAHSNTQPSIVMNKIIKVSNNG